MSEASKTPLSWSDKPFMKKTLVKFGIIFIVITFLLSGTSLVGLWVLSSIVFFGFYYPSKNSFTYYITDRSVKIEKSWVFGNYTREVTFDKILDIHINQGILARVFNCGSLLFLTRTDLGRRRGSREEVPVLALLLEFVVLSTVTVLKERGSNTFFDIREPGKAKELLMDKLTKWRIVYQQQSMAASQRSMAASLGVIAGKAQPVFSTSMSEELTKLKNLHDNSAITKEEYEKAKQKLLN